MAITSGWWQIQSIPDFLERLNSNVCAARVGLMSGNLEFSNGKEISRCVLDDLPRRIHGREGLGNHGLVQMLDDHVPGLADALYEWHEHSSRRDVVRELLSLWQGEPRDRSKEIKEDV